MKNNTTIWKYIKADALFRDYLPHVKSYKYKIRGKNSRGKPISFTSKEKMDIWNALAEMLSAQNTLEKEICKEKDK